MNESTVNDGGKLKPSDVVGTLSDVASIIPGVGAIASVPLNIGKSILKLFGAGVDEGLSQSELDKIMSVHDSFHSRREKNIKKI